MHFHSGTSIDDFFESDKKVIKKPSNNKKRSSFRFIPGKKHLANLPKILSKKERWLVLTLTIVAIGSLIAIPISSYFHFTKPIPDFGGSWTEGMVGAPKQINPLLAQINDVDRDISKLVYAGLTKYNEEGRIVMDLAESYDISKDGLTYTFRLRDELVWHDEEPLSADDIVFTILIVQNPNYNSLQAINWQGVEVSKIDQKTIEFKLKNKYAQFLNNTTLGIMPKHVWEGVKPINFGLSEFNVKPIGSGPYEFRKFKRDEFGNIKSYELNSFEGYYDGQPFIDKIKFKFYLSEQELLDAYNDGNIDGFVASPSQLALLKFRQKTLLNNLKLPRYFSIFFNQNQSSVLSDDGVRIALNYATDKREIIDDILDGNGTIVDSPMLSGILSINSPSVSYNFNTEKANQVLDDNDWLYLTEEEILDDEGRLFNEEIVPFRFKKPEESEQDHTLLRIELTTSDWPELVQVAEEIKKQWQVVGAQVDLLILPLPELQQAIRDRDYEALLFGEVLNLDPDPFSFWHSSQKKSPGLNLALYDNDTADTLLEETRQTIDRIERKNKYGEFQNVLLKDAPAVFLYSPDFIYVQSKKVKGNNTTTISIPSDRFGSVNEWYVDTRRVRN